MPAAKKRSTKSIAKTTPIIPKADIPEKNVEPSEAPQQSLETPPVVNIEQIAKDSERRTKAAINKTPMVPVMIAPVIGKEGEVHTYRLNGVTYSIRAGELVNVPRALAVVIHDQVARKKISASFVRQYAGEGLNLGELR